MSLLAAAATGQAAGPEGHIERRGEAVAVRLRVPELFGGALERLLDSGFELVIEYRVELLGPDGETLASGALELQAAYDLWNEEYVVAGRAAGDSGGREAYRSRAEALDRLRRCDLVLAASGLEGRSLRLRVRVLLQPASAETAEHSRRWLGRPEPAGAEEDAAGLNLFTAFVRLLATPELDERYEQSFVLGPWTLRERRR